ncbi:MAG TPA: hypothetical protein VMT99_03330 [Candidatus Paceibacterota bacterium]|nr:hypothetical protein [Candidatus Paceibacterota bacterium]
MNKIIDRWIPLAFVIICTLGVTYFVVQQSYRQAANDPQTQMAADGAAALAAGSPWTTVVPTGTVDISRSLAPYVVVYDASGMPIGGNGFLNGALPRLPQGVFPAATALGGEDRFTWQPEPGVRSAVVLDAVSGGSGGFVMAGRSLLEAERREDRLGLQIGAGLFVSLVGSLIVLLLAESRRRS